MMEGMEAPLDRAAVEAALRPFGSSRMLPAQAYTDPAVLAWERRHLFADTWTCVGRVGNARLRATVQRVQGGAATCTWRIPPTAKGKVFGGSVALTFEGLRATQAYSGKVR